MRYRFITGNDETESADETEAYKLYFGMSEKFGRPETIRAFDFSMGEEVTLYIFPKHATIDRWL